jgi:hypothetical protein
MALLLPLLLVLAAAAAAVITCFVALLIHQSTSRLRMVQRFSQPAAYAADVMAQYAGELLFWMMTAALAVYHQLAAMKVLPQIAAGVLEQARASAAVAGVGHWSCTLLSFAALLRNTTAFHP